MSVFASWVVENPFLANVGILVIGLVLIAGIVKQSKSSTPSSHFLKAITSMLTRKKM